MTASVIHILQNILKQWLKHFSFGIPPDKYKVTDVLLSIERTDCKEGLRKKCMDNQDFARVGKRKVVETSAEVLQIALCTSISEKKFEVEEKLL